MEIGKSIVKIRKDKNLTQDDLARKYYVTRQTISNWETGKSYPDLETIVKISDDFNISLDVLLKEDNKMVKEIDNKVKANKKYKKILMYIVIIICVMAYVFYKEIKLNKFYFEEEKIDKSNIFSETLTINKENEYKGKRLTIDNLSIANYFEDYEKTKNESVFKVKYNKSGEVQSFYSIMSLPQYVNCLSKESLDINFDYTYGELVKTNDSTRKYLDNHNIKDDVDLLNYLKDKYYFRNTIFTFNSRIYINSLLNYFVTAKLINYKKIVLLNGIVNGYIYEYNTGSDQAIKEIHLLNNDKQYIILLGGKDITTNDYITNLLSTVIFN